MMSSGMYCDMLSISWQEFTTTDHVQEASCPESNIVFRCIMMREWNNVRAKIWMAWVTNTAEVARKTEKEMVKEIVVGLQLLILIKIVFSM